MPALPYRAIAERRLTDRLLRANAVWPGSGQPLEGLPRMQQRALRRLTASGVIHDEGGGRFYLDAPAWAAHMASRRRRFLIAMICVIVAVSGALTAIFGGAAK